MQKMNIEKIIQIYRNAQPEKERFRNLYDDVYRYGQPDRYADLKEYTDDKGQNHRVCINDSTLEIACDDLVNRVQSLIAPPNTDWIDIEAGFMFDGAQAAGLNEANRRLASLARMLNVYKSLSNLDVAMTEGLYDLVAGHMFLQCIEGDDRRPLIFAAVPFREMTIAMGPDGSTWYYFREIEKRNVDVKYQWKDADFEYSQGSDQVKTKFLEATFYNPDSKTWIYWVIEQKDKKKIVEREYRTSPFVDLAWSKTAGETYGRGQGLKVIADFKTLNRVKEYALRALAFTIPFFTVDTNENFGEWVLYPGALIPVSSNANDNPSMKPVEVKQQADLQQWNIQSLIMSVKRGMYSNTLSDVPDQTATAVALENNQQTRMISNSLGRLVRFLESLIKRMIDVLQRQGLFPLDFDINMLNGYGAKIRMNSELGNLAEMSKVQKKIQAAAIVQQMDPTGATLQRFVNMDTAMPKILRALGFDADDIRTTEELAQYDQMMATAAANQQNAAAEQEIMVSNAKEDGKAAAKARYANGQ